MWQTSAMLKHRYFTPTQSQKISPVEEVEALQLHFETLPKREEENKERKTMFCR